MAERARVVRALQAELVEQKRRDPVMLAGAAPSPIVSTGTSESPATSEPWLPPPA